MSAHQTKKPTVAGGLLLKSVGGRLGSIDTPTDTANRIGAQGLDRRVRWLQRKFPLCHATALAVGHLVFNEVRP